MSPKKWKKQKVLFTYLVLAPIFFLCHLLTAQACQHLRVYVVRGHQADWLLEQISFDSVKIQIHNYTNTTLWMLIDSWNKSVLIPYKYNYKNTQIQCCQCWLTPEMETLKSYFCWFKTKSCINFDKMFFPPRVEWGVVLILLFKISTLWIWQEQKWTMNTFIFSLHFPVPPNDNVGCLRRIKLQTCKD